MWQRPSGRGERPDLFSLSWDLQQQQPRQQQHSKRPSFQPIFSPSATYPPGARCYPGAASGVRDGNSFGGSGERGGLCGRAESLSPRRTVELRRTLLQQVSSGSLSLSPRRTLRGHDSPRAPAATSPPPSPTNMKLPPFSLVRGKRSPSSSNSGEGGGGRAGRHDGSTGMSMGVNSHSCSDDGRDSTSLDMGAGTSWRQRHTWRDSYPRGCDERDVVHGTGGDGEDGGDCLQADASEDQAGGNEEDNDDDNDDDDDDDEDEEWEKAVAGWKEEDSDEGDSDGGGTQGRRRSRQQQREKEQSPGAAGIRRKTLPPTPIVTGPLTEDEEVKRKASEDMMMEYLTMYTEKAKLKRALMSGQMSPRSYRRSSTEKGRAFQTRYTRSLDAAKEDLLEARRELAEEDRRAAAEAMEQEGEGEEEEK